MKKILVIAISLLLVGISGTAMATITGSAHDFTPTSGGFNLPGLTQICVVCHTPHNGQVTQGMLWNHAPSTQTYTLYSSTTLNGTIGQPNTDATGISKLCLACHDGTIAVDSFGGVTGTTTIPSVVQVPNPSSDLRGTHPISITYTTATATADGELKDPATAIFDGFNTIQDRLVLDKVECSTCHDVHNSETGGNTNLLRLSKTGSAICLACHAK